MKHCIIAVRSAHTYRSIICHYDECSEVGGVLRRKYHSEAAANGLIELGDLNHLDERRISAFHRDWGYLWNESVSIDHGSLQLLVAYSEAVGADRLHIFEDGEWESLLVGEAEEIKLSA